MSEYEEYVCTYMPDNWGEKYRPHLGEKIVRCSDCAYFATDKLGDYCTLFDFEDIKSMGDKFCAWAERKEGK